jgi:REP element-mobilizing transposase RayT
MRGGSLCVMTYPRSTLVPPGAPGVFHCVSRCVRRAFLCGEDCYTGKSFEHRRQWVEDRLREHGEVFAVSIWGYAVMSNHLHVVVQTLPEVASAWSALEVAERWVRLFPRPDQAPELRASLLAAHSDRIAVLRARLADLSWFMRVLSEPIARRANKEDICKGRFWEGRFKCQALLDDAAVIAAMAYVDLNPVRAGMCETLEDSQHTSARRRFAEIEAEPASAARALAPVLGIKGLSVLRMSQAEYLGLVDFTGRQLRADKHGAIAGPPPAVVARLGGRSDLWALKVMAVGRGFARAVGEVDSLIGKARAMGQCWLHGIGTARALSKVPG